MKRYQGLIKREYYINVGVEAKDLNDARRKIHDMAVVMPPDCYDYEAPMHIYCKEMNSKDKMLLSEVVEAAQFNVVRDENE